MVAAGINQLEHIPGRVLLVVSQVDKDARGTVRLESLIAVDEGNFIIHHPPVTINNLDFLAHGE